MFPAFPRAWYTRVSDLPDPVERARIGRIAYLEESRKRWAHRFASMRFRYLVTAHLLWRVR